MAKQKINQGTAPTGVGGDSFRSGSAKLQANDDELYDFIGGEANTTALPTALPLKKGGTGATTVAEARTNLGLGTAAAATLTTSNQDTTTGRVLRVGDYGLGSFVINTPDISAANPSQTPGGFVRRGTGGYLSIPTNSMYSDSKVLLGLGGGQLVYLQTSPGNTATFTEYSIRTGKNTTVDANGFIKNASPIVKLYADKIETNDEAQQQNITFEKLGVGDYLIKGSSGFAQDGWYIEMPKDANGNVLVAVVYEQLENGDISVKTYDYMLNNKGRIVADTETPLDIPENRWIDLRLQELPQPESEVADDPEQ